MFWNQDTQDPERADDKNTGMRDPFDLVQLLQPGEKTVFQPVCWGEKYAVIVYPHCFF